MKKTAATQSALLRESMERDFEEFKAEVSQLDGKSVFELAPLISAVMDVHFFITTHDWPDAEQADYILKFESPLLSLAYICKEYSEDRECGLGKMMAGPDFASGCAYYETPILTIDDFRDKYGTGKPQSGACADKP